MPKASDLLMARGDGVSFRTKRALREHGEDAPEEKAAEPASEGRGGPGPSDELRARVKRAEEVRAAESWERMMKKRRQ